MQPFNSNAEFSAHGIFLFAVCGAPVRALIASGYTCVCEILPMHTDSRCLVTTQSPISAPHRNFFDTPPSITTRQSSHHLAFFPADPLHDLSPARSGCVSSPIFLPSHSQDLKTHRLEPKDIAMHCVFIHLWRSLGLLRLFCCRLVTTQRL